MSTAVATVPTAALADLLLIRMALPNATPKKVRQDLGSLVERDLSAAELDDLQTQLTISGFLTKQRNTYRLSEAGRERACRFLGVSELPPRTTWSKVIAKYLFPKAAGLSPSAAARLDNGDKLAAFVLKRKYGLGSAAGSTVNQVAEALACKQLGHDEETTLDGLLCSVLSQLMGSARLAKQKLVHQLPLFETGLTAISATAARRKVVRDWLAAPSTQAAAPPAPASEPFDLSVFAATVRTLAATRPPEDRFHDNMVFISALWRASQQEPTFPRLSLADFKQRLLEANRRNLLHLCRADMPEYMDPQLVADSRTEYQNATFHFVLVEGERT